MLAFGTVLCWLLNPRLEMVDVMKRKKKMQFALYVPKQQTIGGWDNITTTSGAWRNCELEGYCGNHRTHPYEHPNHRSHTTNKQKNARIATTEIFCEARVKLKNLYNENSEFFFLNGSDVCVFFLCSPKSLQLKMEIIFLIQNRRIVGTNDSFCSVPHLLSFVAKIDYMSQMRLVNK